jgi:hypothetical protein
VIHLNRSICVGYSPVMDVKWRPANMEARRFYPVYAYENSTIMTKAKDGKPSEKLDMTYYHFVGSDGGRCRVSAGNAVVIVGDGFADKAAHDAAWTRIEKLLAPASGSENPGADLPF